MPVTTSARELMRRYLEGRPTDRSPVVLHIGPYAARLQQMTYREVANDATLLANSLQSAQKLFGCDGLMVLADATLEAEACGCEVEWRDDEPVVTSHPLAGALSAADADSAAATVVVDGIEGKGRLAVALEAARRLRAVVGTEVALFPVVTGPVTLADHLQGSSFWTDLDEAPERADRALELAGRVMLRVARQYLDGGFEQIMISDPLLGRLDPAHLPRVGAVLRALWNVAEFYDAHVLLQTEVDDDSRLEGLRDLGAAGVIVHQGARTDTFRTNRLLKSDAAPSERDGRAREKDAGSARSSATGATEDALSGRPVRSDGQGFVFQQPPRAGDTGRELVFGLPESLLGEGALALEQAVAAWRSEGCGPGDLVACCTIPRSTPPENIHSVLRLLRA